MKHAIPFGTGVLMSAAILQSLGAADLTKLPGVKNVCALVAIALPAEKNIEPTLPADAQIEKQQTAIRDLDLAIRRAIDREQFELATYLRAVQRAVEKGR